MPPQDSDISVSGWEARGRPPTLFRRFEFEDYGGTRNFLDALEELSKQQEYYPDLSFGSKYVNVSVQPRDGEALSTQDAEFAQQVNALTGSG
jgi:pterin-4a-carbinolamine dehydratase